MRVKIFSSDSSELMEYNVNKFLEIVEDGENVVFPTINQSGMHVFIVYDKIHNYQTELAAENYKFDKDPYKYFHDRKESE